MPGQNSVSLQQYIERILDERQKAQDIAVKTSQREVMSAAEDLQRRLESMNQFREQLNEERRLYVKRESYDELDRRIKLLETRNANLNGRLWALSIATAFLGTIIGFGISIVLKFLR